MPELPEVETTRRGIEPYVQGQRITEIRIRQPKLRWPIPKEIIHLQGQTVQQLTRRGKYILLHAEVGVALIHLGMSGSLRIVEPDMEPRKHDHFDLLLESGKALRYHDPRRFGALLWTEEDPQQHALLRDLGPEPLEDGFDGAYLYRQSRTRTISVKEFIMNARIVVGVGNIYANEALFLAGIDPRRAAGRVSRERYLALAQAIRQVLAYAIERGGTTLRDFVREDGTPGYFQLELKVYDRTDQPCTRCLTLIRRVAQGQRSSWFCPVCQH
ncbi:MAG: bifunctional DNA-formamidopyrimidine glycosylase/DNA-(apurinic or apyrimidinic site) lyase [Gammaproteobacteria bacterium]|nr:bifunctional DNA-formamidopyrimidine glycosylase/DNA-(apurinic or apyrimidinic site) lyase [Gammaproteobacteria bacterium]MBU1725140.1 bifunctional DNA-formamidopyrimidine glycosylase/DNA-(apurinic or apyrimidinic site) lyase [Gammaproteobacteria bacterium]MBU2005579.1 bifunctional DNA-formamidopyrimidine glycosylase/DNA-(apurinic or apyrimidinic site) lyase [Gammaproteobacteria bacterium]